MKPFVPARGVAVPLDRSDVDTDQIIPKQHLKRVERSGYGEHLFDDWRRVPSGAERDDFVLNLPAYRAGTVLVAGRNFGCGSSREHAVWALMDYGFRVVIAESFGDIFRNNAIKCGLLPVTLPAHNVRALLDLALESPGIEMTVDLKSQTVTADTMRFTFSLSPSERTALLEGLDDVALTLRHEGLIAAYEAQRAAWLPDVSRLEAEQV